MRSAIIPAVCSYWLLEVSSARYLVSLFNRSGMEHLRRAVVEDNGTVVEGIDHRMHQLQTGAGGACNCTHGMTSTYPIPRVLARSFFMAWDTQRLVSANPHNSFSYLMKEQRHMIDTTRACSQNLHQTTIAH